VQKQKKKRPGQVLRRYTNLPNLMHYLHTESLRMSDPEKWDDGNDRNFMRAYVRRKKISSCAALCFCENLDKYHFWKIFAGSTSGVCIEFHTSELVKAAGAQDIRHGIVEYFAMKDIGTVRERATTDENSLPFMKRAAYDHEWEYRFIKDCKNDSPQPVYMELSLSAVKKIIINPWLEMPVFDEVKNYILDSLPDIRIDISQVCEHHDWRKIAELAAVSTPTAQE
jgi:hypothetical protein